MTDTDPNLRGMLTRRGFILTAMGSVAVSVSGIGVGFARDRRASGTAAASPPGIASQRIDGLAKVTGQKVFARDFAARDLAGWPDSQWHAMYLYALTTDHAFLGIDLSGLPADARPARVIMGSDLSPAFRAPRPTPRRDLAIDAQIAALQAGAGQGDFDRPPGMEFDLIVQQGHVPDFLGQAVALLLFDSARTWRAAMRFMQFRDAQFQNYALETGRSPFADMIFPPETTYVKFDAGNESFSYATADPDTYAAQIPEYRARISEQIAAHPDWIRQPFRADMRSTDPMFMEPETGLVWYDAANGRLNILLGTQSPDRDISDLAGMFAAPGSPVTVSGIDLIACYPGGGFGGRDSSPFTLLLALAAPFADGNPVRLAFDRFEQFRTGLKRHGTEIVGALTASSDQRLQLVEMALGFDGGGRKNLSPYVAGLAALCAGGAYRLPMASIHAQARHSQNVSGGSQRGFGGPQAFFAVETALDDLAVRQGWDPLDLRRANIAALGDTTVAGGPVDQELRLSEILDVVAAHPLWAERETIKAAHAAEGRSYGTGLALSMQAYGTSGDGVVAAVHLSPDGGLTVRSDAVDMGNGSATTLSVVIAEYLGANAQSVDMAAYELFGDTGLTTEDPAGLRWANPLWTAGSVGSSSACLTALHQVHVVQQTARALFEASLLPAARMLWNRPGLTAAQTRWEAGVLVLRDGSQAGLPLADLARQAQDAGLPSGTLGHAYFQAGWAEADFPLAGGTLRLPLDGLSLYPAPGAAPVRLQRSNTTGPDSGSTRYGRYVWAPCANVVGLTVDRSNGAVRIENVLSVLNAGCIHVPQLVSGQSQGGVAMAIGYALLEDMPPGMPGPAGGLWNLDRYHLARMRDLPLTTHYIPGARAQELVILPESPGDNRTGRGIGEAVMCSVAPAISNALRDATGRRFTSLPITPAKILEGLRP